MRSETAIHLKLQNKECLIYKYPLNSYITEQIKNGISFFKKNKNIFHFERVHIVINYSMFKKEIRVFALKYWSNIAFWGTIWKLIS